MSVYLDDSMTTRRNLRFAAWPGAFDAPDDHRPAIARTLGLIGGPLRPRVISCYRLFRNVDNALSLSLRLSPDPDNCRGKAGQDGSSE